MTTASVCVPSVDLLASGPQVSRYTWRSPLIVWRQNAAKHCCNCTLVAHNLKIAHEAYPPPEAGASEA